MTLRLNPQTTALIVVDMQNDFCHHPSVIPANAGI